MQTTVTAVYLDPIKRSAETALMEGMIAWTVAGALKRSCTAHA
jgi:hypothetical protein